MPAGGALARAVPCRDTTPSVTKRESELQAAPILGAVTRGRARPGRGQEGCGLGSWQGRALGLLLARQSPCLYQTSSGQLAGCVYGRAAAWARRTPADKLYQLNTRERGYERGSLGLGGRILHRFVWARDEGQRSGALSRAIRDQVRAACLLQERDTTSAGRHVSEMCGREVVFVRGPQTRASRCFLRSSAGPRLMELSTRRCGPKRRSTKSRNRSPAWCHWPQATVRPSSGEASRPFHGLFHLQTGSWSPCATLA